MPVSRLLAEGKLDIQVLNSLFAGITTIDPRPTGKRSLAPRARDLRHDQVPAFYIRDRDFDFLPPTDMTKPTVDDTDSGMPLGWRWCRHEIENYLIDPVIIRATFGWDRAGFEDRLIDAARGIKHYQAARWAVGQVFPPNMTFQNKPAECIDHPFRLPVDVTHAGTTTWVQTMAAAFISNIQTALDPVALSIVLTAHTDRLTDTFLGDVANVLVWCSGKDLLANLIPWLQTTHKLHPTQLCNRVSEWILLNPDQAFTILPEWDAFRNILRSYP